MEQLTFEKIKALIGERKPTANKGDNGRALIIAGSELMSGAALMCAAAALLFGQEILNWARNVDPHLFDVLAEG